jgi:SSS family solute:Na+ symporter
MKAFSAKDGRTLRRTVVLYPTFQIFLVPILLIGFAGVGFEPPPSKADQILPHLLMNMDVPAVVVGLFCAGALAASMSSGDAISHAGASIVVRDGWMTALRRRLSRRQERAAIRWVLLAMMAASYAMVLTTDEEIVRMLMYAYGPVTQLAPAVYAALFWRGATGAGVLAGMSIGIAVNLWMLDPGRRPFDVHEGLYGLAANVCVLLAVSALTRKPAPAAGVDAAGEAAA